MIWCKNQFIICSFSPKEEPRETRPTISFRDNILTLKFYFFYPQQDHGTVGYQANTEGIDFSNEIYGDNRKVAATPPSNRDWAERLRKESDIHLQHNLDPTSVIKRNDIKVTKMNHLWSYAMYLSCGRRLRERNSNPSVNSLTGIHLWYNKLSLKG